MNKTSRPTPSRRKPRQTRSRTTADAITEAFLQLLVKQSYDKVSIRQIVNLAGVGIGSFYEYFASKASVAAVCVHLKVKSLSKKMRTNVDQHRSDGLPDRVDALIAAQIDDPLTEPEQWAAILLIERQVSPQDAYQRTYAEFVKIWEDCLTAGPDWPQEAPSPLAALTAHSIAYGLVSQSLIALKQQPDKEALCRHVRHAVHGYLSIVAPYAYRGYRFV